MMALDREEVQKKLQTLSLEHCKITNVALVEKGPMDLMPGASLGIVPAHFQINLIASPEPGSHIQIELRLPVSNWNGDFVGIGNGGFAGSLASFVMAPPLMLNFAAALTDMGTSAGPDAGINNPVIWKDFGYRATHLMTVLGKQVTEAVYGTPIHHAYFTGGSTGGQQGLSEAQRYPEDYDGILVCAPAHDRTNLHIGFLWDWLALNHQSAAPLQPEELKKVTEKLLEQYADDGERQGTDAFFYRPDKVSVDQAVLSECGMAENQSRALEKVYRGVFDPVTGERIHEGTVMPCTEATAIPVRSQDKAFADGFLYIIRWALGKDFDLTQFDFHRDTQHVREILDGYLNATNPDLSAFKARGGKLILLHGTADDMIPCGSSIRYWQQVKARMGDPSDFFHLYLIPGMGHLSGGPGMQDILFGFPALPKDRDHFALLALKHWVETDEAPAALFPVAFKDHNVANAFSPDGIESERIVSPYQE